MVVFLSLWLLAIIFSLSNEEQIYVSIIRSRSNDGSIILNVNKSDKVEHIYLTLKESVFSSDAEYIDISQQGNTTNINVKPISHNFEDIYTDSKNETILVINGSKINGVLHSNDSDFQLKSQNETYQLFHINNSENYVNDEILPSGIEKSDETEEVHRRSKRQSSYQSFPNLRFSRPSYGSMIANICLVIDNDYTQKLEEEWKENFNSFSNSELLSYLNIFWKGVFSRYNFFPQLVMKINKVIKTDLNLQYFQSYDERRGLRRYTDALDTLKRLRKKIAEQSSYRDCNIWYYMSGNQFYGMTTGMAYSKSCCSINGNSAAIGYDSGKFIMHTATHELGHVLGSPHDGDREAIACSSGRGYIMDAISSKRHGNTNLHKFSSCSQEIIFDHVISNCHCFEKSPTSINLPEVDQIPNVKFSKTLDQQCKDLTGDPNAYYETQHSNNDVCSSSIKCKHQNIYTTLYNGKHPMEYTICGKNQRCIKGVCSKM